MVALLSSHQAQEDGTWGPDHGAWTVLKFLYPGADVPGFQLSIDMSRDFLWHLEIGRTLSELRDRGVFILGSGNVVHNLAMLSQNNTPPDFALEFDSLFAERLDFVALADRNGMSPCYVRRTHPPITTFPH